MRTPALTIPLAVLFLFGVAHADSTKTVESNPETASVAERVLEVGAALGPGLLVHGLGHLTAGETKTGLTLLAMEGIGAGIAVGGITSLALSGAAHEWIVPSIGLTGVGVGLFVGSYLLDVYGVLSPEGGFGSAPVHSPWSAVHIGYRHVVDPVREVDGLLVLGGRLIVGQVALTPTVWRTPEGRDQRFEIHGTYRLAGPPINRWGNALELDAALVHHRYDPGAFDISTGELTLTGRWDMGTLAPSLAGSYTAIGMGLSGGFIDYDGIGKEPTSMLLMRFEFGVFLGHESAPRGRLALYYDHRHDGYVAGMKSVGVGSGALGHLGALLDMELLGPWGLALSVEGGSAIVSGLSLTWKGERR